MKMEFKGGLLRF